MASAPEKHEWLVVVPDLPGTLAKRLAVRAEHLSGILPSREAGIVKFGGGIVNGLPANTADPNTWDFAGSSLVVVAESQAEVVKLLEQDIYTKSGVWDVPKAQIYWLKTAFRDP